MLFKVCFNLFFFYIFKIGLIFIPIDKLILLDKSKAVLSINDTTSPIIQVHEGTYIRGGNLEIVYEEKLEKNEEVDHILEVTVDVISSPIIDGDFDSTEIKLSKELDKCYDVQDQKTYKHEDNQLISTTFKLKYNNCHHFTKQWWFPASITIGAVAVVATAGTITVIKSPRLRRTILPFNKRR